MEHLHDYEIEKLDSHMSKHHLTEHAEEKEKPSFTMKVVKCHTSALTRQVQEAILIQKHEKNILNSRGEYNRCQLPRLTVMMGEKEVEDRRATTEREDDLAIGAEDDKKRKVNIDDLNRPSKKAKRTVRWRKPDRMMKRKARDEDEMSNEGRDGKKRKDDDKQVEEDQTANQVSRNLPVLVKNNEQKKNQFSFLNMASKVKSTPDISNIFEDKISCTLKPDERIANSKPAKNFYPIFDTKLTPSSTQKPTATYKRGEGGVPNKRERNSLRD